VASIDWNDRYAGDEFIYGTHPNEFLAAHATTLRGPVLSIAEGEGRNAVFLAKLGYQVHGVDGSAVGLAKAQSLAAAQGVEIQTEVADLAVYQPRPRFYNSVISISAHLPATIRHRLYPLLEECLLPNGLLLLEAYSENQLSKNTGGPQDPDMLLTVAKIQQEFPHLEPILLQEIERDVSEGTHHTGHASVVQFIGRKPA
jgi:cyclopropane fatty-acyl-phospholipid synthase-like methyltransferase